MWLPEEMNQQAANKLLKLIEEPPKNTYGANHTVVCPRKKQTKKTIKNRDIQRRDKHDITFVTRKLHKIIKIVLGGVRNGKTFSTNRETTKSMATFR